MGLAAVLPAVDHQSAAAGMVRAAFSSRHSLPAVRALQPGLAAGTAVVSRADRAVGDDCEPSAIQQEVVYTGEKAQKKQKDGETLDILNPDDDIYMMEGNMEADIIKGLNRKLEFARKMIEAEG